MQDEDFKERIRPQAMAISHVSRAWRDIAITCPELWGILHVGVRTQVKILNLAFERSQHAPLFLNIRGYGPFGEVSGLPDALTSTLNGVVRAGSARLLQMALHAREDSLQPLFSGLTGTLDRLVSLQLTSGAMAREGYQSRLEPLSRCSFPSLQHLDTDYQITADHALLQSSPLAFVKLPFLIPTTTTFSDLSALMKRSTYLRRFRIAMLSSSVALPAFDLSSARGDNAIHLPELENFEVHSTCPDITGALLSSIRIPIRCRLSFNTNNRRITSVVKRAFGNPAPMALNTREGWVEAWDKFSDIGRLETTQRWIDISHGNGCMVDLWEWGWSLNNLRILSIGPFGNPVQGATFWRSLAENAIALETLILGARCVSQTAIGDLMGWLSGMKRIAESQQLAWPALRQLFTPLPTERNYDYKRIRDGGTSPPVYHQAEFALDLRGRP
ncbi:hypothetical protein NMY22_g13392 [Coprinellus aureogranulatus]|nr:hypothetical protein NMY22_g13392 [Coprinellus aureogranulatus]